MSDIPSNLHTHTVYCDGKDTPEALVLEAIRLGCPVIGFSGHSHTPFDASYCMTPEGTAAYCAEVQRLKRVYAGQIQILLGVEQDYFSESPTEAWDFVIGSVHYLRKNGEYRPIDHTLEGQLSIIRDWFGGDAYAFAEACFEQVGDLYRKTHCDIIGHFDVVSKFGEQAPLLDWNHPRYRAAADRALAKLIRTPVAFEINTGAMARGLRTTPYPDARIQAILRQHSVCMFWTSDCHKKENLLFGMRPSEEDSANFHNFLKRIALRENR